MYLFLAVLGLCCYVWASSSCGECGPVLLAVLGLPSCVASVVADHRLWSRGSVVAAHRLSCSLACGIHLDQGLNTCLLHWQMDSLPLSHQGSPQPSVFN